MAVTSVFSEQFLCRLCASDSISELDTYAESYTDDTAPEADTVANQAAANKIAKYDELASMHIFYPAATETRGNWNHWAVELVQKIGRESTLITGDPTESFDFSCFQ